MDILSSAFPGDDLNISWIDSSGFHTDQNFVMTDCRIVDFGLLNVTYGPVSFDKKCLHLKFSFSPPNVVLTNEQIVANQSTAPY